MHRWMLVTLLFLAPLGSPLAATRVLETKDIFQLHWVTDPQIRADGRQIAFVRHGFDKTTDRQISSVWTVDVASKVAKQVASGPGQSSSPRWSPDGQRLAYLRSGADGTIPQIALYSPQSGQTTIATDLKQAPRDLSWSADGHWIAFVMLVPDPALALGTPLEKPEGGAWAEPLTVIQDVNFRADGRGYLQRGRSHVFVVSAEGGPVRQVSDGPFGEAGPLAWSPDGREILLAANREPGWERDPIDSSGTHPRHRNIYRVSVADGGFTPVTHLRGSVKNPAMSPDGKHVAYLGYEDRNLGFQQYHLTITDREGSGTHTIDAALAQSVESFCWSADGHGLFVGYTEQGDTKVAQISTAGKVTPLAAHLSGGEIDLPYSGGAFSVASNGTLAYTGGAGDTPSELYVRRGSVTTRLTDVNEELLKEVRLAAAETLPVRSSFDQRAVGAWMIKPAGYDPKRKYPLILEIHGGPYASYGPVFSFVDQLFAAAGYEVVYANPRGSTSYGEDFANLIQYHFPEHDFDDLMSVVDAAIQRGDVDSQNLFVTGASGGGVLSAWTVGTTNRFRAAASRAPVIDWSTWVVTSDVYAYVARAWFRKLPWEDHETYWSQSPLSRAGNVTTPTLMVVGDQDLRTTVAQAESFYGALQLTNTPTVLVKIPGAAHAATRPSQITSEASAILAWFNRYRKVTGQ